MPRSVDRYVICVENGSYRASLQPRKVYRVLEDPTAEARSLVRVIDESGEDYLFPGDLFVPIELPAKARPAFAPAPAPGVNHPARRSIRPTKSKAFASVRARRTAPRTTRLRKV